MLELVLGAAFGVCGYRCLVKVGSVRCSCRSSNAKTEIIGPDEYDEYPSCFYCLETCHLETMITTMIA